jgi:hypothetical protein
MISFVVYMTDSTTPQSTDTSSEEDGNTPVHDSTQTGPTVFDALVHDLSIPQLPEGEHDVEPGLIAINHPVFARSLGISERELVQHLRNSGFVEVLDFRRARRRGMHYYMITGGPFDDPQVLVTRVPKHNTSYVS